MFDHVHVESAQSISDRIYRSLLYELFLGNLCPLDLNSTRLFPLKESRIRFHYTDEVYQLDTDTF